jgi:predicted glycoside hydrolase/deacetylase ChbG (UPF0249 family)
MPNFLIVNADDFGMTPGHNRAIVDAFQNGIVTSTSLLANGYAFDDAVMLARQVPSLGVGVHLTLTEGLPVAPDLDKRLTVDNTLPLSNQPFVRTLLTARLPVSAIRCEFEAQITKIIDAGIMPTHIDGHKYIHALPVVSHIAAQLGHKYNIPVMRVPFPFIDRPNRLSRLPGLVVISLLGLIARIAARRVALQSSDHVVGFVNTGKLSQSVIRKLLSKPRSGITELLCHPAYRSPDLNKLLAQGYRWIAGYDFDGETAAVSDPNLRNELVQIGWKFCNYSVLAKG